MDERYQIAAVAVIAGYAAATMCAPPSPGSGAGGASSPTAPPTPRPQAHSEPSVVTTPAGSTAPAVEIANPTVVALVPMKHTSLRVPGKNYRKLGDKPLCCWVLQTLCGE